MSIQTKHRKTGTKRPKPNLHGPNSPTPKKKTAYLVVEDESAEMELELAKSKAENRKRKINAKPKAS